MVVLFAAYFARRREDEETEKHLGVRLLSVAATVVAIILFLLTEDLSLPLVLTDKWTLWHIVITIVTILLAVFSKKKYKEMARR
jgi:uncharacterized membrane protein